MYESVRRHVLRRDGAQLTAHLTGEPGDLQCAGTVHDGVLAGKYSFNSNPAFVQKMSTMGFSEITPRKQEGSLMLDVTTAWVREMKDLGVTEMTASKLTA